jgi:hypothetical protein
MCINNILLVAVVACLLLIASFIPAVAQDEELPSEIGDLQNQLSVSTGGMSAGGLSISKANGNVSYTYPISSYSVSGYPVNVSLNYCGGVAMTTFNKYVPDSAQYYDYWDQFNVNQPAWIVNVNGFALQVLSKKERYCEYASGAQFNYIWNIDGYDFCNRMNVLTQNNDQDIIKILRGDGGILELRNPHQKKDITLGEELKLYTGYYYSNSVNNKAYGIVTLDSVTWWPAYAKDSAAAAYPERYASVPRVLKYYPGDGLEYVFREHPLPYGPYTSPSYGSGAGTHRPEPSVGSGARATIFYLEEVNSSLRTLLHFKRSRHNFGNPSEPASTGRAQLTSFEGHRFSYGENSLTIEALGRTVEVKVKSRWKSDATTEQSLQDECVMDELGMEPYDDPHDQSWLYMVSSIRDAEAIRDGSSRKAVNFEYERHVTTFQSFRYPNSSSRTWQFPVYRLERVTEPSGAYSMIDYHTDDGAVTTTEVSGSSKKILYDLSHAVQDVLHYDKDNTLLVHKEYLFYNAPAGYDRKAQVTTEDNTTGKGRTENYYYKFYEFPAYKTNNQQSFMTPNALFPALEKVEVQAGDVMTTTATIYANNLYTVVGNSGAGRFVWAPVSQLTTMKQGTGATLITSYNVFSYQFEQQSKFGGDDSLQALFGYVLKERTTETRNPADTSQTLMKGRSEYLNLPMLMRTVTRTDSIYNEESSKLATAAARRSGQQKTVLVFDVLSRTAEEMNIPPLYGLLENSYAIDPATDDVIAGTENEYETGFTATTSPLAPRGALLRSYRLGQNNKKIKTGEVEYSGGWYRNIPRSGLNVFGAKSSSFLDYADAPSLAGNTNNYPTGTKVYNTNSSSTETLYDVHHLFEVPLAAEQYVRYWNPTTSMQEVRTLAAYTQRTFHGQSLPVSMPMAGTVPQNTTSTAGRSSCACPSTSPSRRRV